MSPCVATVANVWSPPAAGVGQYGPSLGEERVTNVARSRAIGLWNGIRRAPRIVVKALSDACDLPGILLRNRRVRRSTRGGRRIFIDLGAFDGDTLELAMSLYPDTDLFVAFEPSRENLALLRTRFMTHPKVRIVAAAAGTTDAAQVILYHATGLYGHSLLQSKANVSADDAEEVEMIDFSRYVSEEFKPSDHIVLKIDIEGSEYDLLERMIEQRSIDRIATLFCEWHHRRVGVSARRHRALVRTLRREGLSITGRNRYDEFARQNSSSTARAVSLSPRNSGLT
jgi:FkbM family methyltransferase